MYRIKQSFNNMTARQVGLLLAVGSLVMGIWGYTTGHSHVTIVEFLSDFYANISTELGSIAITVLVIDTLNQRREDQRIAEREQERREEERRLMEARERRERHERFRQHRASVMAQLKGAHSPAERQPILDEAKSLNLLQGARLFETDLQEAKLKMANMRRAYLVEANLDKADLRRADLVKANLTGASLHEARLWEANLCNAYLYNTDFDGADLREANLTGADLYHPALGSAKFTNQTTLPDGSKWRKGIDLNRFTDSNHPNYWRSTEPLAPEWSKPGNGDTLAVVENADEVDEV